MSNNTEKLCPISQEMLQRASDANKALAAQGTVLLEVELTTEEEAAQLYQWLFVPDNSPMKSSLKSINWNKRMIKTEVFEALSALEKSMECPHGNL